MTETKTTFVALLRGINVGKNMLKMDRLRAICESLGAENVRTYLQSGNVVFRAKGTADHWTKSLEKKLAGETRLPVSVLVRTAAEIAAVAKSNPFLKEKGIDTTRLAVTFLQQAPSKESLAAVAAKDLADERFHVAGRELYLHCPSGFAKAKLYLLDKPLAQKTTFRNWNSVTKLAEMAAEQHFS
jgi:uncharacterized protein (DUF1697 family)